MFQHDEQIVHCVLGSVSSNSMFPTSWIICFDSGLKEFNDWFCRRSCRRACRSGWFSIFWINCRTLVLCAYFTTESGSHRILKSMSASFTIIGSWLSSWSAMEFSILLRSISPSKLNVSLSWARRIGELSCTSAICIVASSSTVLSEELSSSRKELTLISWERDVFLPSCSLSSRPDLSRIGFGVGWVGCLSSNFSFWLSSNFPFWLSRATFEPNSLFHSWFNEKVTCTLLRDRLPQFSV